MIYFLVIIFVILMVALYSMKFFKNMFSKEPYYIIIQLFVLGMTLNSCILLYNKMIFKKIEIRIGHIGKQGETGQGGLMGNNDTCGTCDNDLQKKTIGSEKLKEDKKKIIVETPVLSSNIRGRHL